MAVFQGVFFLIFGLGLLGVSYQSLSTGVLPCGPNGLKGKTEFSRRDQPALFWLMFAVYGVGGLWLTAYALLLFTGIAVPLPLR